MSGFRLNYDEALGILEQIRRLAGQLPEASNSLSPIQFQSELGDPLRALGISARSGLFELLTERQRELEAVCGKARAVLERMREEDLAAQARLRGASSLSAGRKP
jgi:hypothetical protein